VAGTSTLPRIPFHRAVSWAPLRGVAFSVFPLSTTKGEIVMRMSKGSTSNFWTRYNRQQNALAGACMPSLLCTMTPAETYPVKQTNSGMPRMGLVTCLLIANDQNLRRAWTF
jgi:hypothetical protein